MNKFGFFIQTPGAGLDLIEQYKPTAVLLMDAESQHIAQVRAASPDTTILYWMHEGGKDWRTTDPQWWAEQIWGKVSENPPDIVTFWNEPLWHGDFQSFPEFDARQAEFIRVMRSHGIRVGAFRFAEGNFTQDGPRLDEYFPESVEELDCIFINEYWFPHYWSDGMQGWHCARWPYWLQWLEEVGKTDVDIYVTECGSTSAIVEGPDEGWMGEWAKGAGVTDETYLLGLGQYHELCCLYPQVKAVLPFIWYPWPGQWGTFRHDNRPEIYGPIMEMDAPGPTNGGSAMKIYDFDNGPGGQTTTWEWLQSVFGDVQIEDIENKVTLHEGDVVYKIDYLDARVGDANIIINVRDVDGNPVQGETTIFGWPDAPPHGYPEKPSNWTTNGVTGDTNENGDVGPGLGTGAYYSPNDGERGPHFVWVWDLPSDYIDGLGMLPGGYPWQPHAHINIGYRAVVWGEEPPPPPSDGHAARLHEIADEIHSIANDLGPGGINQIVVEYSSGETEIFKPVASAVSSVINLVRRIIK